MIECNGTYHFPTRCRSWSEPMTINTLQAFARVMLRMTEIHSKGSRTFAAAHQTTQFVARTARRIADAGKPRVEEEPRAELDRCRLAGNAVCA